MSDGEQKGVKSIDVGFRLIDVLLQDDVRLPLKELAGRAEMSPSKAHSYLASFKRLRLITQDAKSGNYGLGPLALEMGLKVLSRETTLDHGDRAIRLLRTQSDLSSTLFLSIWTDFGPVIVMRDEGLVNVPLEIRVGFHLSLLGTATGLTFLAHLPEVVTAPQIKLENRNAKSSKLAVPSGKGLEKILTTVREKGVAIVEGVTLPGFSGTAVPIFDHSNRLGAVLTYICPTSEVAKIKNPAGDLLIKAISDTMYET